MSDITATTSALDTIAERVRQTKQDMTATEELIKAMKDAGENVAELESVYRQAQLRLAKWNKMLVDRGYQV